MEYSKETIEQYRAIQDSGVTNMFDRIMVESICNEFDFYELGEIASDSKEYAKFLISFKIEWLDIKPDEELVENIRKTFKY